MPLFHIIFRFYSRISKALASFCGCTGRFVSGLVGKSRRHVFKLWIRSSLPWKLRSSKSMETEVIKITGMNVAFLLTVSPPTTMTITNRLKITLTLLRLHSASSVRIPNSINNFRTLIPALRLRPLNLLSASSVNLHGLADTSIFHNNLRVMLSPLKSPLLRKYSNPFKRPGMYPSISKCNAKRCNCCMHLCTNLPSLHL